MRRRVRDWFQHLFNSVHVYCRLKDCGVPDDIARDACRVYEWVYRRLRVTLVALATGLLLVSCFLARAETTAEARWCSDGDGQRLCLVPIKGEGGGDSGVLTLAAASTQGGGNGY
uniref:Uncharacterized protein n=1 Tax=Desulfovibrio sp. U5L TaxID=596152 RepID=I2Q1F1_9BACT